MADLLQEMSQRLHAGGNIFSGDLVAGNRFSANQQTVERARDPKIIRRELLAGFLGAIFVGVGGDHVPFPHSELYSYPQSHFFFFFLGLLLNTFSAARACDCSSSDARRPTSANSLYGANTRSDSRRTRARQICYQRFEFGVATRRDIDASVRMRSQNRPTRFSVGTAHTEFLAGTGGLTT